jgi:hypothetical protein
MLASHVTDTRNTFLTASAILFIREGVAALRGLSLVIGGWTRQAKLRIVEPLMGSLSVPLPLRLH